MKYSLAFASLLIFSMPVFADSHATAKPMEASTEISRKLSPHSVADTMDKFETIIKSKGFDVFARIDHQKNAEAIDMKMNPAQVIIFGNPKGGTMLMSDDIRVALDLPLRVVVYQDADEKVYIAYREPVAMVKDYDLESHKVIGVLTDGLNNLTAAAVAE